MNANTHHKSMEFAFALKVFQSTKLKKIKFTV